MSKQTTRPWAVRVRRQARNGNWQKWRTHGTYTTFERATAAADKTRLEWIGYGYPCEAYVRHASLESDVSRETGR